MMQEETHEALTMSEPLSHHAEHFRLMTGMKVNPVPLKTKKNSHTEICLMNHSNPPGIVPIMTGEPTTSTQTRYNI